MTDITQQDFERLELQDMHVVETQPNIRSFLREALACFLHNKIAIASAMFILIITLFAILAPMLNSYSFNSVDMSNTNIAPGGTHPFGTDMLGRDLWARVWVGTRISLFIGITGAILPQLIGFVVGCVAGYSGGWVDMVIMGVVDIGVCVPSLVYLTLVSLWLDSGLIAVVFAIAISGWMDTARMVRSRIMQYRNREFVLAARLQGASAFRIVTKHILPNISGYILVSVITALPTAIFFEAYLSYIGLGVVSPLTSLGQLCQTGTSIFRLCPYQLFIPGSVISCLILAFYILGNCIRDILDPYIRQLRS